MFFEPETKNMSRVELASHRVGRDRVARVEREVGLVGPHLVLVVREVHPPVRRERLERRVGEQPLADAVVQPAPGEEQPMRGLVTEDVEQAVPTAHPEECEGVGPPASIQIAAPTTPNVCRRHPTTVTALRAFEMRRSWARTAGTGMPDCCSLSVGSTSGSEPASGSIVVAMAPALHFQIR